METRPGFAVTGVWPFCIIAFIILYNISSNPPENVSIYVQITLFHLNLYASFSQPGVQESSCGKQRYQAIKMQ